MDCHFESICESCTFFVTTVEFPPTLKRQRDDAATKGQVAREQIESSAASAQRVVDDTRTSSKSCTSLHYTLNQNSIAFVNVTGMSLLRMGDGSAAAQPSMIANGNTPHVPWPWT